MVVDLDNEIWKDIKNYEGMYQISNYGRVKSFRVDKTGRLMSIHNVKGYCSIGFTVNKIKKDFYIHRLVLETFQPIDNMNLFDVNHKDEDKTNNKLDNLEWLSHKDNINYGNRNEIAAKKMSGKNNSKSKKIRCIETGIVYDAMREAERILNIPSTHICQACKHPKRTAGGFHWEYVNEL